MTEKPKTKTYEFGEWVLVVDSTYSGNRRIVFRRVLDGSEIIIVDANPVAYISNSNVADSKPIRFLSREEWNSR
jgi:hypothetical protein